MRNGSDHSASRATLNFLTTLGLGGPAGQIVTVTDAAEIPTLAGRGDEVLVLAGGSNVVISDNGFPGTVLLLRTTGVQVAPAGESVGPVAPATQRTSPSSGASVLVTVAAGESWDALVARAVAEGWSGLECLSGIPGSAGATPIQNVGAYGQEVAETITAVTVYDRIRDEISTWAPERCGFGYRTSVFKHSDRWIVLDVTFRLARSGTSAPIRYPELAATLAVPQGGTAPLAEVRRAVLGLRRSKGMVIDADDPDTRSVGSFFTNPVLDEAEHAALRSRAAGIGEPPFWPAGEGRIKTSAAWLIDKAGFAKGYQRDGVGISTKHPLALTNRGTGSTAALLDLAREIRDGVLKRFDVELRPEPVLVNCRL